MEYDSVRDGFGSSADVVSNEIFLTVDPDKKAQHEEVAYRKRAEVACKAMLDKDYGKAVAQGRQMKDKRLKEFYDALGTLRAGLKKEYGDRLAGE